MKNKGGTQKMHLQNLKYNPRSKEKEIKILRDIGLRDDEIQYLIWLKIKKEISKKYY